MVIVNCSHISGNVNFFPFFLGMEMYASEVERKKIKKKKIPEIKKLTTTYMLLKHLKFLAGQITILARHRPLPGHQF